MISTITQLPSVISVSVGHEARVRGSQQAGHVETIRATKKTDVERIETTKIEIPQNLKSEPEQFEKYLNKVQEKLQLVEPRIEFSVDKELGQVIFRLFDKESGDLIRQIPSEQVLELDRFFADQSGLFVKEDI